VVARGIDVYLGVDYVKNAVIIGFFTNEVISIVENMGLMGVPMPAIVSKAVDLLTSKSSEKRDN
jgi:phage-related holin